VTSHGELEIELWANECPKTCRNFIQLCLEGYYDDTIFHRLIPGFMIQGGDPTGTGNGGTSIYNQAAFADEIHMRLRFTHRGLLAMANSKPNENLSQFFITFDACPWLDKKNTIFGKITGNTIYNLLAMEKLDTDSDDRPVLPPKILGSRIIQHPFEDIIVR
jgi:peptidyl-prolyl cis-trans isomerase SDCCAG10